MSSAAVSPASAGLSSEQILADYPDQEPEVLSAALDYAAREIDLRNANDPESFCRARAAGAAVMSKALDFSASGLPNSPGLCSPGQRRR